MRVKPSSAAEHTAHSDSRKDPLASRGESHPSRTFSDTIARAVAGSEAIAALIVDLDLRVDDASPAAERVLGRPLRGLGLDEAVLEDDCARLRRELATGRGGALLLLRARPEAAPAPVSPGQDESVPGAVPALLVTLDLLAADELGPGRALLIGRAATEELMREARVRRAARYEIVGQIASGVAHELNNLLSTVTTFSDLLLGDVEAGSTAADDLADIKQAGLDASRVVRKLDLFACGLPGGPAEASPAEVVRGLEKLLRRFLPTEVTLETELDAETPAVSAPPTRVEEILLALAANARDAMPDGGTLHIAVGAGGGLADGRASVAIEVSDTGDAFPPLPLERATEPFFSTRPLSRGSGLGLATAAGVVSDLRGSFVMESRAGGGTRVRVELPVGGQAASPQAGGPGRATSEDEAAGRAGGKRGGAGAVGDRASVVGGDRAGAEDGRASVVGGDPAAAGADGGRASVVVGDPAAAGADGGRASVAGGAPAAAGGRAAAGPVLVIEPRAGLRGVLMRALARDGTNVEGAARMQDVERRERAATPSVVVVDVPDRPGGAHRTVDSLRRLWPAVPVLLMRGRIAGDGAATAFDAVGEVFKPFALDAVHQGVARLLHDAPAP